MEGTFDLTQPPQPKLLPKVLLGLEVKTLNVAMGPKKEVTSLVIHRYPY